MKKKLLLLIVSLSTLSCAWSQISVSQPFPNADQPITIIYDATQGASNLQGVTGVKMHSGVILSGPNGTNWEHVIGDWGNPNAGGTMTSLGNNKWSITITPRTYYASAGLPANATVYRLGMVFRETGPCGGFGGSSGECKKGAGTVGNGDLYIDLYLGGFDLAVTSPSSSQRFINAGSELNFVANTTDPSDIVLRVNGEIKASVVGQSTLSYNYTVSETDDLEVSIEATKGSETKIKDLRYVVRAPSASQPRPSDILDGINYHADATKVTLSFLAPLKSTCYVIGEFNNWQPSSSYQMKKDGEHFWLELAGLVSGQEYAFQYLVDETLAVADPFADKILDPNNDQYITGVAYPDLKTYPDGATGIVSVFQTNQTPYTWQTSNYVRPAIQELNVYELLVRDFDAPRTYQAVIDRLDYLENLGINAIELMPIMEFSGNDSWGYNPIFYFAVDKAYGTKNKLKELVDKAHSRGIAVILDMVLNQADYEFPYVKMYWSGNKPSANNPWFNTDARHPFSVFFDFNHESQYTKNLVDTINHYWLTEYKFDGFRFDLSKGFTQNFTSDVNVWGNYDQSRVDILTRMANKIWSHHPDAYVILEHLGSDSEERVLANNGMTLWGIMTEPYKQISLGYASSSDISRTFYKNRSGAPWNNPGSIMAYMESHDEERIMYNNLQFGNSSGGYSVKQLKTAIDRVKAAFALLLSVPGPKMIWQFGELGYDVSINENGRTGTKPIRWEYFDDVNRKKLYKTVSELFKLRNSYDVFQTTDVQISSGSDLFKSIVLKQSPYNPSPTTADEMNVLVLGNFNVTAQSKVISFPHTGNWYHYFSPEDVLNVSESTVSIQLQPGEFRIYTDVSLPSPEFELTPHVSPLAPEFTSAEQIGGVVVLTWIDKSQIETGFKIFRKKSSESTFIEIGQVGENVLTFTDRSLQPVTGYQYYIEAFNLANSSNSQELQVTTDENVLITDAEDELANISIFPNPATDHLRISSPNNRSYTFQMIDEFGRIVFHDVTSNGLIDLSELTPGLYFLKILGEKSVKYVRFVKI